MLPCGGVEESADEPPEVAEVRVPKDEALCLPTAAGVDVHLGSDKSVDRSAERRKHELFVRKEKNGCEVGHVTFVCLLVRRLEILPLLPPE